MPHRLVHRILLRAPYPGWRWWLLRHTPTILIDYLLEVLLTAAALITSTAYFTGLTAETAVIRLLPDWLANLYAGTLLVAAATVILGLVTKRYATTAAYGLRLLAIGCAVYAFSAAYYLGLPVLTPIVLSSVLAILAFWRAFLLRSTYLYLARQPEVCKPQEPG